MKFRKILPIFSIIMLLSLTNIGSVYSTTASVTNTPANPISVDNSVDTLPLSVTTGEIPAGETITDIDITVDFEKLDLSCTSPNSGGLSFAQEISMSLQSPEGTVVNLVFDQTPGPASYPTTGNVPGMIEVVFDDSAVNVVGTTNGGIPESGTFQPAEPLSAFNDELPHGMWTFTFGDDIGADPLCLRDLELHLISMTINEIPVGGTLLDIDTTSLILAGGQSTTWMIPVVLSALGIALFTVSRKTE